jgi:putative phosphoesterase
MGSGRGGLTNLCPNYILGSRGRRDIPPSTPFTIGPARSARPHTMYLAVLSDTHGHLPHTRAAIHLLESFDVKCVIHCGDIGSERIVELFSAWPTHFVFGNVDEDWAGLRRAIQAAGQTCHDRFGVIELLGRKIAFLHGDDAPRLKSTIAAGSYDLVCYGHTHRAEQHLDGATLVLNPGALYRAQRHTIAIVELPALEAQHVSV